MKHVLCCIGFGPIGAGLFVKEAFQSGNFSRLVVAEIDATLVQALRANKGRYSVNVARADGVERLVIEGIEILNPAVEADRIALLDALAHATEIVTSLPSVKFFETGGESSVASLIAQSLSNSRADATIIYTAENNNHAAEILEQAVRKVAPGLSSGRVQFLNTVIGKMSQVVTDAAEIASRDLAPIAPGINRAFLVEQFNEILVTRTTLAMRPGIEVFLEKDDLLPFEEAKLYGHNAIHALLGFLAALKGYTKMPQLRDDQAIMHIGRDAFLNESGAALVKKYRPLNDELFTEPGYRRFAEDLLERMTNPHLADTVERTTRDVVRKLGPTDRIFGTMSLALDQGIEPANMAIGALAGIAAVLAAPDIYKLPQNLRPLQWQQLSKTEIEHFLAWLWSPQKPQHKSPITNHILNARHPLAALVSH